MSARLIERVRAVRNNRDAGLTLAELLVSVGLSTIVGVMTVMLFLNVNSTETRTLARSVSASDARNAIEAWTAALRVADGPTAGSRTYRIEWLTSFDMLFHADLFNRSMSSVGTTSPATTIWLRRDSAGNLIEEQFASTATSGSAPTHCRTMVSGVSGSAGTPLFSARDSSGNLMSSLDMGAAPTASAGCRRLPVTLPSQSSHPDASAVTNLQNVWNVTIDFIVRDTTGQHPIEFTSQAVLPALGAVS